MAEEGGSVRGLTIDTQEASSSGAVLRRTQSSPTDIKPHTELYGRSAATAPFPETTPLPEVSIADDTPVAITPETAPSPHRPQVIPQNEPSTPQHSTPASNANPDATAQPSLPQFAETPNPSVPQLVSTASEPSVTSESQPASKAKPPSVWYAGIKSTLAALERASDVFTPLKSAVASVNVILETKDAFSDNHKDFEKLSERLKLLNEILQSFPDNATQELKDRRDGLERTIRDLGTAFRDKVVGQAEVLEDSQRESVLRDVEELGKSVKSKLERSVAARLAFAKEDQQEVIRIVREINFAIEFTMLHATIRGEILTLEVLEGVNWLKGRPDPIKEHKRTQEGIADIQAAVAELRKAELYKRLGDIQDFAFSNGTRRGECLPGTRVGLTSRLLGWAVDRKSRHAFWLSGPAGTGKTALSETFCSQLSKRGLLGASFFCSIKAQDLSDIFLIIPTLAKALARSQPAFNRALARVLDKELRPDVDPLRSMKVEEQYKLLILRPAEEAFRGCNENVVVAVDALDECTNNRALASFFDAVLLNPPPAALKIFFTSRPEASIKQKLESPHYSLHRQSLHDVKLNVVRADISLYVSHELWKVPELQTEYGDHWPPAEVDLIVEQAHTLFIIAATIVRYIDDDAGDPLGRLQDNASTSSLSGVEELYERILKQAFKKLKPSERENVHACLSLLVVGQRPLSVIEYAELLGKPVSTIRSSFRSLHSVVNISASQDSQPISIYHASFIDFLTSTQDSGSKRPWAIGRAKAHILAAEQCLGLMDNKGKGVFFGISGAATSYRSNNDQKLTLRSDLAYACTSWADHVLGAQPGISDGLQQQVEAFLDGKWLYWIEALSAEGRVGYARILHEVSKVVTINSLKQLVIRIWDFWRMFATPISYSAPHLYLSALPFYEAALGVPDWISVKFPSVPIVCSTGMGSLARGCKVIVGHAAVFCIAISPDGNTLASGSDNGVVQLWDAWSGDSKIYLEGHTKSVMSVCFSPDGSKIASGSYDETVRLWDVGSGQVIGKPLEGHTGQVTSVCFSPDGSKIVSGSGDKTVRLWDVGSGQVIGKPLEGHTNPVQSVCFSPDSSKLASGSQDTTLRVWGMRAGSTAAHPTHLHSYPASLLSLNEHGWICNNSGDLLLWVPPQFRPSLQGPSCIHIIGGPCTKVELTHAVYHGTNWLKCIEPPPETEPNEALPWPVATSHQGATTTGDNNK